MAHYTANVIASGGAGEHVLPLAHNDAPGNWTVRVKDMLSGQEKTVTIRVD